VVSYLPPGVTSIKTQQLFMQEKNTDPRLDISSEANREKHINFLDAEDKTLTENISDSDRFGSTEEDEERRKQWQQGLEEGRKAAGQTDE
jgi:hypothetical protein